MSGHAELVKGRIVERRQDLATDSPEAVDLVAVALAAMHDAAYGQMPAIRCDRQVRYRGMQLAGEKALPLEDLVAIALRGPVGAAVALAAIRPILVALRCTVAPLQPTNDADMHESLAQLAEHSAAVEAGVSRAMRDSTLDPSEACGLAPLIDRLKATVGNLEAVATARATGRTVAQ